MRIGILATAILVILVQGTLSKADNPPEVSSNKGFARHLKVSKVDRLTFRVTQFDPPNPNTIDTLVPILGRYGRGNLVLEIEGLKKGQNVTLRHAGDTFATDPWPDRPVGDTLLIDMQKGTVESIVQSVNTAGDGFDLVFPNVDGEWQVRSVTVVEWDRADFRLPVDKTKTTHGDQNPPGWYKFVIPVTGMPVLHDFPLFIDAQFKGVDANAKFSRTIERARHLKHDIKQDDSTQRLIVANPDSNDLLSRSDIDDPNNPGHPISDQSEPITLTIEFSPGTQPPNVDLDEILITINK